MNKWGQSKVILHNFKNEEILWKTFFLLTKNVAKVLEISLWKIIDAKIL